MLIAAVGTSVAGCGQVPRDAGFARVASSLATRQSESRVVWRRGGAEEAQADEAAAELLKGELTSDAAVQVALLNNRRLQATYETLMISQADLISAGLLKNPIFDAQIRYREGGGGHVGMDYGIAFDFLSVFQIPLRRRIANANFAGARAAVTAAVLDLSASVRRAYVDVLAAQETLVLRQTALDADRASAKVARKLRDAGNIIERDAVLREATAAQSELDVAAAAESLAAAREHLTALLGLDKPDFKLPPTLPPLPDMPASRPSSEEDRAVNASLPLAALRSKVDATARQVGLSRTWGLFPDAEVGVVTERDADTRKWETGPSFSLPIPLFDQGQAGVATAAAELRRARAEYAATATEFRAAYRAAASHLAAATHAARHVEATVMPMRVAITRETQLQYNAMQVGAFELLEARRRQVDAGLDAIRARRDALHASIEVNLLLAGGTPHGMTEETP